MTRRARVYLWAVVFLGLAAFGVYAVRFEFTARSLSLLVLFSFLAFLSQIYEIEVTYRRFLSGTIVFTTAAILISGGPFAIWVVFLSTLLAEVLLRHDLVHEGGVARIVKVIAFNTSQHVLTAVAGSLAFALAGGHPPPWTTVGEYLSAILVFVVCFLVNTSLVSGIITLNSGVNFVYQLTFDLRHLPVQVLALGTLAILVGVIYALSPWYLAFIMIPLGLVHLSLRGYTRLRQGMAQLFEKLLASLVARDPYTASHSEHVALLSEKIARRLGLREEEVETIKVGARIHDIGKVGVPDSILLKPGELTEEEWEIMKQHPIIGADLLTGLEIYNQAIEIVRHEHERWDGSGYPDGLKGLAIPLGARIVAVTDVWDALTTDRPHRKAFSKGEATTMMTEMRGTKLDPRVVDVLFQVLEEGQG